MGERIAVELVGDFDGGGGGGGLLRVGSVDRRDCKVGYMEAGRGGGIGGGIRFGEFAETPDLGSAIGAGVK